jgi:hypothetical protein
MFAYAGLCAAQQPAEVRDQPGEWQKLKDDCGTFDLKHMEGCAEQFFTGKPLHIAVGSIAPQNGFGAGLAYVDGHNTRHWRISWNADAVGSNNGSWRAGAYVKFAHAGDTLPTPVFGTKNAQNPIVDQPEHSTISIYAQTISLNKIAYFGIGPFTSDTRRTYYGMRETIAGANAVRVDISKPLKLALYGEANGRFVTIRPSLNQSSPTIGALYNDADTPGLMHQPGTLQFGEGLRMTPVYAGKHVRLNYKALYQQFISSNDLSFQRLTFDLGHKFAIYPETRVLVPNPGIGPDYCSDDPGARGSQCAEIPIHNLEGSFGLRALAILSMTPGANRVPFYYQPTLGGTDINGAASLGAYQDYRFRAPNLLLVQESFEHSLGKLPIGVMLTADQGRLGVKRSDLSSSPWLHTFAAGLTLRAGGFPEICFLFAFGGHEGTHTIANVNTALLGSSARPSLW